MNNVLVKTFSYIIIINIIITNLLEHLLIKVTVKANKFTLMVTGRRGKGVSP